MKKESLSLFNQPELILLAFLLFFFTFLGIVIWTFHKSNKKKFERASRLPLEEQEEQQSTGDREL